jgi:hypothetical protein
MADAGAVTSPRELTITRVFDAPRDLVLTVWTDPAHLIRWWGPTGFTATAVEMDVRHDGASSWRSTCNWSWGCRRCRRDCGRCRPPVASWSGHWRAPVLVRRLRPATVIAAGLLDAARGAFTQGLHVTAVTSAASRSVSRSSPQPLLRDVGDHHATD